MSPTDPAARRQAIGRFPVATDIERVAAFGAAIALTGVTVARGEVPLTFPLTWWMEPPIKNALVAAMGIDPFSRDAAVVHLDQGLTYRRPLTAGESYWLDLVLIGPDANERFRVEAQVLDADGAEVGTMAGDFARRRQAPA